MSVCSAWLQEALNCIKSALMFTQTPIHFVIYAEDSAVVNILAVLKFWTTLNRFYYEIHSIVYPDDDLEYWKNSKVNCTAQMLFFPDLLTLHDALIYVHTDVLFLGAVDELWRVFAQFDARHVAALAPDHNDHSRTWAWYTRFAKHPFYGDFGLDTGVMLMNLTRMREFGWVEHVHRALRKWSHQLRRDDQDIINIIFDYHPDKVLELSCRFNYRSDVPCEQTRRFGIFLLHGNNGLFHKPGNGNHVFQATYTAFNRYMIGTDPLRTFLPNLKSLIASASGSYKRCKHPKISFLKMPINTLYKIK